MLPLPWCTVSQMTQALSGLGIKPFFYKGLEQSIKLVFAQGYDLLTWFMTSARLLILQDYFEFIGPGRSENNKAIAEWLKTNK